MSNNFLNVRSDEKWGEAEQLLPAEAEHVRVCPPTEESIEGALASFALGLLPDEETKTVAAHMLVCATCLAKFYMLRASLNAVSRRGIILGDGEEEGLRVDNLEAALDALEDEPIPDIPLGTPETPAVLGEAAARPHAAQGLYSVGAGAAAPEESDRVDAEFGRSAAAAAGAGAQRAGTRRKFLGGGRLAAGLLLLITPYVLLKLYQNYVAPRHAAHDQAALREPATTASPPSTSSAATMIVAPSIHEQQSSPPFEREAAATPAPAVERKGGGHGTVRRAPTVRRDDTVGGGDALVGASCALTPDATPASHAARAAARRARKIKGAEIAGSNKAREVARAGGKQLIPIYVKVFVKDDKSLQRAILVTIVAALKREKSFKVLTDASGAKIPDDVYEVSLDFDKDEDCFGTLFARLYDPNSTQIWDAEKSCHSYPKREMLMLTSKELVGDMVPLIKEHESGD